MAKAIEMPFRSAYSGQVRKTTETGSPYQDEYSYKIDSYGRKVLKKKGKTNLYAKIQESLEETKIENILARAVAGDTSMLRPDGIYADLSQMPSNLLEARQAMQELENTWNGLENEIKAKYNYDLDQFIGQSGSESWLRDMGLLKEKQPEIIQEAVKEAGKEAKADE